MKIVTNLDAIDFINDSTVESRTVITFALKTYPKKLKDSLRKPKRVLDDVGG